MVQNDSVTPARRGRPRSFDADQALAAVRDTFWRKGYAATSLDDLCASTGLNRPSLYGAFGDKRALYIAVLQRNRQDMISNLTKGLAAPGALRERLLFIFSTASALYRAGDEGQRGCFLIGTAVTESVADPDIRQVLHAAFQELDDSFAGAMRGARDELPPGADPDTLARMATGLLHTLAVRARAGADEASLEAIYETGVALICGRPVQP